MSADRVERKSASASSSDPLDGHPRNGLNPNGSGEDSASQPGFHVFRVSGERARGSASALHFLSETELQPALREWLSQSLPVPLPQAAGSADALELDLLPEVLDPLVEFLEQSASVLSSADMARLTRAFVIAHMFHEGTVRKSGEPYILHPLAVASILQELGLDAEALCAALLHDVVEDSECSLNSLEECMGREIAALVDGVTKLQRIDNLGKIDGEQTSRRKAESLRKMFVAMVDDTRVVLVKLADRVHNMRTLDGLSPLKRQSVAQETLQIFAPLANRLGIGQFKWELEDLSLRHLDRETYDEISRAMAQKRQVREEWARNTRDLIKSKLEDVSIKAAVTGRPKHIYSVYRKMERKGIPFSEVYDIQGFRIVTESVTDCYASLGVIHGLWRPIPGEFDDYIASPKENMYQSLHTAVIGPDGNSMEVQIRTQEMHEVAELGVAAHWHYKEQGSSVAQDASDKMALLRSLIEWPQEDDDAEEFVRALQSDVFQEGVYVFTPQGEVIDLPRGATPIDFAYKIHTELGERCRGATVNGEIVPLNYKLQNSDQVYVMATNRGGPSRDWLNLDAGFVRTQRARSKIVSYFRRQGREDSLAHGRVIVDRELKRHTAKYSHEDLAVMCGYKEVDDFLAALGYSDFSVHSMTQKILERERREQSKGKRNDQTSSPTVAPQPLRSVEILGQTGLFTQSAGCCKPLPGDDVQGYITRGKGVTVHRRDCPNLKARLRDPEEAVRIIEVQWGQEVEDPDKFDVTIEIQAYDRAGLLRDITAVVADEKLSMSSADAQVDEADNVATVQLNLELHDARQFTRVMNQLDRLANVRQVRRITR